MKAKIKSIFFVFLLLFLSVSVFAQNFGFDFQFGGRSTGGGRASGFSNVISDSLDLIFGGIIRPIFDSIGFYNFEAAVKVALWIILFMLFSHVAQGYFKNMPAKFAKVIAAIVALFGVAFIPSRLLEILFRDFLAGIIGYLLFFFFIFFPMWGLHKFSKGSDEKAINMVAAAGFFLMMIFLGYIDSQIVYAFNFGIIQNLASLTITFGILASLILFVHRLIRGFKGTGSDGEETPSRQPARRGEEEEEDEAGDIKGLAQQMAIEANNLRSHIHNIPDHPEALAEWLKQNSKGLNFINIAKIEKLHKHLLHLENMIGKIKGKQRRKANSLIAKLIGEWNNLHTSVQKFFQRTTRRHLQRKVDEFKQGKLDKSFFRNVSKDLKHIDEDLNRIVGVLSRSESL